MGIAELLELRTSVLMDIDETGRLLVGHDETGSTQLYEIDGDGRWTQLTDLGEPCAGRYLPGQRTVVLSVDDGGTERAQLWLLHPDQRDGERAAVRTELVIDPAHIHSLLDVLPDRVLYATNRRNDVDFDVIARTVSTGAEEVLFDGGGWFFLTAASPDERWIVLGRLSLLPASSQLLLVDTSTGKPDEITDATVLGDWTDLHWLADSSAFLATSDSGAEFRSVRRFDVSSRTWSTVLAEGDADLRAWPAPDGRQVAVVATSDGADRLRTYTVSGDSLVDPVEVGLPHPGSVAFRTEPVWSADSSGFGVTFTSFVQPPEVYVLDGSHTLRRRTTSNPGEALAGLVAPSSHRVPTPDGEQVPAYVFTPSDLPPSDLPPSDFPPSDLTPSDPAAGAGGGRPVVIEIHGGPEAASVMRWNPVTAALVQAGHLVVVPNVRGSDGYGRRWVSLDDVDKRLDSVADLAAIHAWLPTVGGDQERVALYGGSYGGYMVLAGLTFQPELWAAGVDIVGMSSLVTFLENTSAYRRAYREREYGSLAHDREFLQQASPLSRIDDIAAPLFVIHGANDPRVPLSEAEQVAAAVRRQGLDCEMHVYADEGHGLAKRKNRLDAYPRALEFLGRHLGPRNGCSS